MHAAGWTAQLVIFFLESGENAAAAPRASTGAGGATRPSTKAKFAAQRG